MSGNLQDLEISAEVVPFDRPVAQVDSISAWPNLSLEPLIESSPVSTQVLCTDVNLVYCQWSLNIHVACFDIIITVLV